MGKYGHINFRGDKTLALKVYQEDSRKVAYKVRYDESGKDYTICFELILEN